MPAHPGWLWCQEWWVSWLSLNEITPKDQDRAALGARRSALFFAALVPIVTPDPRPLADFAAAECQDTHHAGLEICPGRLALSGARPTWRKSTARAVPSPAIPPCPDA